jgi:hypothetical protein
MDSTAQRALVGYEIFNENLVATESEIINETASTGDAWIRQHKEPMWAFKSSIKIQSLQNQKSSTKLLPRVMHGFDSANSPRVSESINETATTGDACIRERKQPCGLRNHQRKWSRWRFKNHQ